MRTFTIYHVPGDKIGLTEQPIKKRIKQQGLTEWEVMETHTDGWLAGDREIELQKQYGYKVEEVHYMIRVKKFNDSRTPETYRKISESRKGMIFTKEHRKNISIAGIGNSNAKGSIRTLENREKIAEAIRNKPKRTCPNCGLHSNAANMNIYHFDNCKH